ncbi:uncharacterized protein LOC128922302 [Zeugodacus cucurbitae]|uniref:uncharacterized protein LOC128922302 n=1 Tax=Zeugodacus cucurbitae TaxID=28588 RepID=UPI0023D8E80B|nr:uncharacterized protein LOC128922302 [Zeugodacus cucurbitae]XP_054088255.1 uncharacterized protein LOC128922302 [Zeugodacus cucurbitae]
MIDKLTVYYDLAIRRNCDSLQKMYNAIWATYYHCCSSDEEPQHDKCPEGTESWCDWQKAAAANQLSTFEHDYEPLPKDVAEAIRPIFTDLSSENLLEGCVGESYNQLIWKISPKIVPAGSKTVETAAYIAAGIFNEGMASLLYYMNAIGITIGPNAHSYAEKEDEKRVSISDLRARESTRDGRMARRQYQLELLQVAESAEGVLYGPGIDNPI